MAETLPQGDEVYCFLNQGRPCSAECIAYKTIPDRNEQLDTAQPHCVIVNALEKTGRGIHVLSAVFGTWMKDIRAKAEKEASANQTGTKP